MCFSVFLQQGGDKNSSHSSSNTLSSNASSSNSDEKHFGSGDLMDPEMLGLTYIKGASTDSGIDTAPCSMTPGVAGASVSRVMLQGRGVSDPGHPWKPELAEEGSTEEDHGRLYLPRATPRLWPPDKHLRMGVWETWARSHLILGEQKRESWCLWE